MDRAFQRLESLATYLKLSETFSDKETPKIHNLVKIDQKQFSKILYTYRAPNGSSGPTVPYEIYPEPNYAKTLFNDCFGSAVKVGKYNR